MSGETLKRLGVFLVDAMERTRDLADGGQGKSIASGVTPWSDVGRASRDSAAGKKEKHAVIMTLRDVPVASADACVHARHCKITASKTITLQANSSRNPSSRQ